MKNIVAAGIPVSAKVATQLAVGLLTLLVAFVVTRFGLQLTGQETELVTGVISLVAGGISAWFVKEEEAHPQVAQDVVTRVDQLEHLLAELQPAATSASLPDRLTNQAVTTSEAADEQAKS